MITETFSLLPVPAIYFLELYPELIRCVAENNPWMILIVAMLFAALTFSFSMRVSAIFLSILINEEMVCMISHDNRFIHF